MADDPLKHVSMRVFLAVPLHDIFHKELDLLLGSLREEIAGIHWVGPRQVHLTLHFFGSIPASEIERIDSSMQELAMLFSPLRLSLDRIGGFPNLERPRIVWLGVKEDAGTLLLFQQALQNEIKRLGFEIEARPFHPHATIGRVKKKVHDLRPFLSKVPFKFPAVEKNVDRFVLYQSHLLPEGASYEVLKTYPLSKKA